MIFLVFNFASAEEMTPIKVQLNWEHEVEFAGYYAAIEQGYYEEFGLSVELIPGGAGLYNAEEMEKQNASFAIMECLDLITSKSEGYDLRAVSAIFQKHPGVLFTHID